MYRRAILVSGLVLVGLAAALRPRPEEPRKPHEPRVAIAAPPDTVLPPSPVEERSDAIRETTRCLGLEGAEAETFEVAARKTLRRIQRAWLERDARVLAVSPSLGREAWEAEQREAHQEYEREKDEALRPLLAVMDEREEYLPLRLQVEQWIDSLKH